MILEQCISRHCNAVPSRISTMLLTFWKAEELDMNRCLVGTEFEGKSKMVTLQVHNDLHEWIDGKLYDYTEDHFDLHNFSQVKAKLRDNWKYDLKKRVTGFRIVMPMY